MGDDQKSALPAADLAQVIDDARQLKGDLERLLSGSETALLKTDVKEQIEKLNQWVDTYIKGLSAAKKMSEDGLGSLKDAQAQLNLSLDEYTRMEGEGGVAAPAGQAILIEELNRALRRITHLVPEVETHFTTALEVEKSDDTFKEEEPQASTAVPLTSPAAS